MVRLRALIAAVAGLLFYSVTDILVWQRIFEANQMVGYANSYHIGWLVSLLGYAAIGVIVMSDHWKDCLYFLTALFIGAFCGLEDILYYVLDGKPIPASLPWLHSNPLIYQSTRLGLISSVLFWLTALGVLFLALHLLRRWPGGKTSMAARSLKYR